MAVIQDQVSIIFAPWKFKVHPPKHQGPHAKFLTHPTRQSLQELEKFDKIHQIVYDIHVG